MGEKKAERERSIAKKLLDVGRGWGKKKNTNHGCRKGENVWFGMGGE